LSNGNKPFVVRSTQKRLLGLTGVLNVTPIRQLMYVCFGVCRGVQIKRPKILRMFWGLPVIKPFVEHE